MKEVFCKNPFQHLEINPKGEVYNCLQSCIYTPIGNAFENEIENMWNGPKAQKIRASIIAGEFRFCKKCPVIKLNKLPKIQELEPEFKNIIKNNTLTVPHPETIKLSYDRSCNLYCTSCRDKIKIKKEYQENAEKIQANLVRTGWLKKAKKLIASGCGELFVSKPILQLLNQITPKEYPNLKITLFTNGLLLTKQQWHELSCKELIKNIRISVDAATKETYEKIRRNSNFEKLIENLKFINQLRKEKKIEELTLTFVVQKDNYKEMLRFIRLCDKFNADIIQFMQIKKWNKFSDEEYKEVAIHKKSHPEHQKFLKIMQNLPKKGHINFELLNKFIKKPFCDKPFSHFEIRNNGDVYLCCSGLLPHPIGNILKQSIKEIWNSEKAQEIRKTILDGTFKYCQKKDCPILQNQKSHNRFLKKEEAKIKMDQLPKVISCCFDKTCNLYCQSCRKKVYFPNEEEVTNAKKIKEKILNNLINHAKQIIIAGSGDPFASPTFKELLNEIDIKKNPQLTVVLFTNANLFTKENWEKIKHLEGNVSEVRISIDSATKETYEKIRRNGNFEKLIENLKFINQLRKEKKIEELTLTFVVQKDNYKEMPEFIELGRKFGCNSIIFTAIRNWGTYSKEEFKDKTVHEEKHPEHQQFLQVINSITKTTEANASEPQDKPKTKCSKVTFGTLKKFRKEYHQVYHQKEA